MERHRRLNELRERWQEYVAEERDAGRDPLAAYVRRYETIQAEITTLREYPPSFDAENLETVLSQLDSAKRVRRQIIEANDLDILVPTLRAFLFGEEGVAERFDRTVPNVRYAGPAVLGELFGWVHAEEWPIYTAAARHVLAHLHNASVPRDYVDFARRMRPIEKQIADGVQVAPEVPLAVELAAFFDWAERSMPETGSYDDEPPRVVRAIREFGATYEVEPPDGTPDRPLEQPSARAFADAEETIRYELVLPPDTIRRAAAHLLAGRHLILTGAPGTGKSHLAALLASELFGYYPMIVTATAEWSAFDVVGGLVPAADADGLLRYEVRPGYVYEALRQNWLLDKTDTLQRTAGGQPLRRPIHVEDEEWQGVWLIIDELNRADIDKAFGDLFTALETGRLRVPALGSDRSQLVPLPRDFRIIATLNTRDRHFLFTLSDALKRRFAFLELTPPDWVRRDEERDTLLRRAVAELSSQNLPVDEPFLTEVLDWLHPIALLIRAFHPLGTAPLLAALRYAGAARTLTPDVEPATVAVDAYTAEIVPQLEGVASARRRIIDDVVEGRTERIFTQIVQLTRRQTIDDTPATAAREFAAWMTAAAEHRGDETAAERARRWSEALEMWAHDTGWPEGEVQQELRRLTQEATDLVYLLPAPLIRPETS